MTMYMTNALLHIKSWLLTKGSEHINTDNIFLKL